MLVVVHPERLSEKGTDGVGTNGVTANCMFVVYGRPHLICPQPRLPLQSSNKQLNLQKMADK